MFRCTECQLEYKEKPDFCDCGNDIFEEILSTKSEPKPKKYFEETYPSLAKFKDSLDPISVGIFTVCIILSILSLIFLGNSKEELKIVEDIKNTMQIKIKDIDEIWDDTPVKIVQEKKNESSGKIEDVAIKVLNPKTQLQKTKTTPQSTKKTPVQTNTKVVTKTNAQSKATLSTPKTTNNSKTNTKNTAQLKPTISTKTEKTNQNQSHVQNTASAQELKIYKNSLRNLLFSKIDFTQIQGDGIGIVSFKIEGNGKLSNKAFVQRSNNEQLDDALFYSLNTTSSYKAPPSSYGGETLKFKVKFVGGQYEVSLN